MLVKELIEILQGIDPEMPVRLMIGCKEGTLMEDLEHIGFNDDKTEVYIPANFDIVCTHEAGRELIN